MSTRSKLISVAIGGTSLAVLAAAALALGGGTSRSAEAATPAPSPAPSLSGVLRRGAAQDLGRVQLNLPHISGLELQPLVAPGGVVKVDGTNFGTTPGSLCLQWTSVLVQNVYTTNNRLCLEVVDWQDGRVVATVPQDVEGVPDQTAQLVVTAGGAQSNPLAIKFVATRESVQLVNQPVSETIECSSEAEQNGCGPALSDHWDGFFISFGNEGTDHYHFQLANGWTFQRMDFSALMGSAAVQAQPQLGGATIDFSVNWSVGGTDTETQYSNGLWLLGPKGVPLQLQPSGPAVVATRPAPVNAPGFDTRSAAERQREVSQPVVAFANWAAPRSFR
jgi:hypothetical protein